MGSVEIEFIPTSPCASARRCFGQFCKSSDLYMPTHILSYFYIHAFISTYLAVWIYNWIFILEGM